MSNEINESAPLSEFCLLDDLMEQGVVKLDLNLAESLTQLETITEEKEIQTSPSHDSDSGYSMMTSPTYSFASEELDGRLDMLDFDNEIASYLSPTSDCERQDAVVCVTPVLDFNKENFDDVNGFEPIVDMCSDMKPNCHLSSKTRSGMKKLEETLTKDISDSSNKMESVPSLKVIKVIKTPSTATPKETEQQILDALDDRNRKNAIQAKINREKKKAYIKSLETEIETLRKENAMLKNSSNTNGAKHKELLDEVMYLRSVLANQSTLSALLKNIPGVANVKLASFQRKRSAELDHSYESAEKRSKPAGICLHVDQENVSLEFCHKCSQSANDHDGS